MSFHRTISALFQSPVEEGFYLLEILRVLELGAAVAGAVEDFELDFGTGGFEGCREDFALFHGDERVGVAVLDEEGRIVLGGVAGGVGLFGEVGVLLDEGAD